jgi:hypothetical protein
MRQVWLEQLDATTSILEQWFFWMQAQSRVKLTTSCTALASRLSDEQPLILAVDDETATWHQHNVAVALKSRHELVECIANQFFRATLAICSQQATQHVGITTQVCKTGSGDND